MSSVSQKDISRFESKIEYEPNSGCWLWSACARRGANSPGHTHGMFFYSGKSLFAHRFSYMLYIGSIPPGGQVNHTCHVPECVNPRHLYLGTQKDNMCDRKKAGNQPRGALVNKSDLTDADVIKIRDLYASCGYTYKRLGIMFGVHLSNICLICKKKIWTHI